MSSHHGSGDRERRQRGLEAMSKVYGWQVEDSPGDFFGITVDHLFADIWTRPGLTNRERRLMLIATTVTEGLDDVTGLQLDTALGNEELTPDELREIVIFLTHYVGWPKGAKLNSQVEEHIAKRSES